MAYKELAPSLNVEGIPDQDIPSLKEDLERLVAYRKLKAAGTAVSHIYAVPILEIPGFDASDNAVFNAQFRDELDSAMDRLNPQKSVVIIGTVVAAVASTVASKIVDKKLKVAVSAPDELIIRDPVTGAVLKDDFTVGND